MKRLLLINILFACVITSIMAQTSKLTLDARMAPMRLPKPSPHSSATARLMPFISSHIYIRLHCVDGFFMHNSMSRRQNNAFIHSFSRCD